MTRKVLLFDTTLRDGEQGPGASMDATEKLAIARELLRLKVDVIEAGFPASSPGDFASVQKLAELIGSEAVVCALARAVPADIKAAGLALAKAQRGRIHTGLGVSPSHLKDKLQMSEDTLISAAVKAVRLARRYVEDVQFYAEDAGRAERPFLARVLEAVIQAGAQTVCVPDTTGALLSFQYAELITWLLNNVRGIEGVTLAVHCHDDLGQATAASVAAVAAGAGQVECTINGIGERAGNAALEEVAVALAQHGEALGVSTGICLGGLTRASRLVASVTGIAVPPNKAIVGRNAFAHSSGIHQDGVLKNKQTYELIDPASVGAQGTGIVLTARSGRAALRHRLGELGIKLPRQTFDKVYARFLEIADKKSQVYDEDLEALMAEYDRGLTALWQLRILQVSCGSPLIATATVVLDGPPNAVGDTQYTTCVSGTGPIDATFKAINQLVFGVASGASSVGSASSACSVPDASVPAELQRFAVLAITRGSDALGEVSVQLSNGQGREFSGRGADGDIIVSSAKAYLNALNRLLRAEHP